MVMDEFGSGQVVQQSLIETNADWHMERVIDHLKRANPTSFKLVRVIMVDKDLNEIKVLQREFPEAQVLICHFHVLTYLEKVRHKPEFGKLSEHDHAMIQNHIHRCVYSEKEFAEGDVAGFQENKAALIAACERLGAHEYLDYLRRNWFGCTDMWALYTRNKLPHLKNHTNNRLECWFGKFKKGVCESTTMADCVKELLKESRRCQRDYELAAYRPGRFYNENYDDEMTAVLMGTTPFVARIIETQYVAAKNKFERYAYDADEDENVVHVRGTASDSIVDLLDFSCGCKFVRNMRLPCRHAMAYRAFKKMTPIIPLKRIDIR
jgi:hypothetical protein